MILNEMRFFSDGFFLNDIMLTQSKFVEQFTVTTTLCVILAHDYGYFHTQILNTSILYQVKKELSNQCLASVDLILLSPVNFLYKYFHIKPHNAGELMSVIVMVYELQRTIYHLKWAETHVKTDSSSYQLTSVVTSTLVLVKIRRDHAPA